MSVEEIKNIIESERTDVAFVFGNGINLFNGFSNLSWLKILSDLWWMVTNSNQEIPRGISLTEYYDVIELNKRSKFKSGDIQKLVVDLLKYWEPSEHHNRVLSKIQQLNCPVLTTNFDEVFKRALNLDQFRIENDQLGFTDFYPWDTYHSHQTLELPTNGFGIWYINGMIRYSRSIRLGLTHYMGSVERARRMIHNGDDGLFKGKDEDNWIGVNSWLHILFNKDLIIFGLTLDAQEVFLRWLLLERAMFYRRFPNRRFKGWYVYNEMENDLDRSGKLFFLEQVGIKPIALSSYQDMYDELWS